MINKLHIKFGMAAGQENLALDVSPITVFVGPNNSGKSRVLIEIENYCRNTTGQPHDLLLAALEFAPYTKDEIEAEIAQIEQTPEIGENVNPRHVILGKLNPQNNKMFRGQVYKEGLIAEAQDPSNRQGYYSTFLSIYTVRLDGTNRLNLLNEQNAGDLQSTPANHLAHLFKDDGLREEVRRIVFEAFGKYFVIDPTNMGKLRVRLSDTPPENVRQEKSWEQESIDFHRNAVEIANASDGVKAFTGIVTTILAGDPKVALIDEPEAFLPPALSSKLGKEVSLALRDSRKRLFVSTHSADFLMGCIQSGSPMNIVRLTYNYDVPTARVLPQEKLIPLMRNPLLRSTGVLSGLFYQSVVVAESDADRAFYQEVNERLLAENDPRGISNCLFLNAQNKQTVWQIVKPLRELGIPALGVVDIDVLKDGGVVWTRVLESAFVPNISHEAMANQRLAIQRAFEATERDMKRDGGIGLLDGADREACQNTFNQLADYGILIVPGGELESWLQELGATGHSPKWLIDIFERMGSSRDDEGYVQPADRDVWDFIGLANNWLSDVNRKGIPTD